MERVFTHRPSTRAADVLDHIDMIAKAARLRVAIRDVMEASEPSHG